MPSKKSRIQLYADECFPVTSVTFLKSLGYSVVHAYDYKLVGKSDITHLRKSKQLNKILITLDRDFLYYKKISLEKHPGVIVISVPSTTPKHINEVCKKLMKNIKEDFIKNSLLIVSKNKITKMKKSEKVFEKRI